MKQLRILTAISILLLSLTAAMAQSPTANISGQVNLVSGDPFSGVDVVLLDDQGNQVAAVQTDNNGAYLFAGIPTGVAYSLALSSADNEPLNGVTTFDGVLIARHILGIQSLSTPYQIIASDVNGSNTATTFDIVLIRRLVLGITQSLDIPHWRFVRADLAFPDLSQVFPVLQADNPGFILAADFTRNYVAIKTGDVNGSAIAP